MEWGYCEHCNKEVPVVAGMLEVHHTMSGNTGARDECSNLEQIECRGSMCSPSVMPQGGDAERYRFSDAPSDLGLAASRVGAFVREHLQVQVYPHQEPYLRDALAERVEVNGLDISGYVSSIEIHDEVPTREELEAIQAAITNVRGISSAWEVSEALLSLQEATWQLDFYASQCHSQAWGALIDALPTPLGAIADGWGAYHYPDDPAEAFRLAGARVDQPVYLECEYDNFEPVDVTSDSQLQLRHATYRITQRDSHGTMLQPLDITHLLNHYQGRVGVRAVGDLAYLSFT